LLPEGPHEVVLQREGHAEIRAAFEVKAGKIEEHHWNMERLYMVLDTAENTEDERVVLPLGEYQVDREGIAFAIRPSFPQENRIKLLRTAIPISIISSVILSGLAYASPPENSDLALIPTISAQVATLGLITYAGVLNQKKHRYLKTWRPPENPYLEASAAKMVEEAREMLERGNIDDAAALFELVITAHPYAPGVTESLYTLGRLLSLEYRYEEARRNLHRLIDEYPTIEYYDRAHLQLARLALQNKERETALYHLESLTYTHPSITPESVETLKELTEN
jgi:tetratricopeptide (TPR) repeat protein